MPLGAIQVLLNNMNRYVAFSSIITLGGWVVVKFPEKNQ